MTESIKANIKFISLIFPFCILYNDSELLEYRKNFFSGLKISCYIQLIWELIQVILWNVSTISLNEVIFGKILKINIDHKWTFISDGRFRPAGVSWEPANLGLSLAIGYCLTKNKYCKFLFLIGSILSTSRTGILIILICILIDLYKKINKKVKVVIKKRDMLIIILLSIGIIIFFMILGSRMQNLKEGLIDNISVTIEKLSFLNLNNDSSANFHLMYYFKAPFILINSGIVEILFGYGTFAAGYPYSSILNMYTWSTSWNPESDFITILMGNGILGLIMYIYIILNGIRYNKISSSKFKILICLILAGIFYINIRSTWPFLIIIMLFIKDKSRGICKKL